MRFRFLAVLILSFVAASVQIIFMFTFEITNALLLLLLLLLEEIEDKSIKIGDVDHSKEDDDFGIVLQVEQVISDLMFLILKFLLLSTSLKTFSGSIA